MQATVLEKERNWEVQRENETHVHGMRTSVICAHVRRARTNMALRCREILGNPAAVQLGRDWMELTKTLTVGRSAESRFGQRVIGSKA